MDSFLSVNACLPCQLTLPKLHIPHPSPPFFSSHLLHPAPPPGTNAPVYIQLKGSAGETGRLWLGPAAGPGQVAEGRFSWGPLGALRQLMVGLEVGSGDHGTEGWHLDYVEVVHSGSGQVGCLGGYEGVLQPGGSPLRPRLESTGVPWIAAQCSHCAHSPSGHGPGHLCAGGVL